MIVWDVSAFPGKLSVSDTLSVRHMLCGFGVDSVCYVLSLKQLPDGEVSERLL
jgi:hypothetical protein